MSAERIDNVAEAEKLAKNYKPVHVKNVNPDNHVGPQQVYQVSADDAGEHPPDREIPQRRFVECPTACPSDEQRRRERDACRRENAEGLDGDRPDLQRRDDEVRDQSINRRSNP